VVMMLPLQSLAYPAGSALNGRGRKVSSLSLDSIGRSFLIRKKFDPCLDHSFAFLMFVGIVFVSGVSVSEWRGGGVGGAGWMGGCQDHDQLLPQHHRIRVSCICSLPHSNLAWNCLARMYLLTSSYRFSRPCMRDLNAPLA